MKTAGLVAGLMYSWLLCCWAYTKLPEADVESSLLLTCVGRSTCRALFPKQVQSPNYTWNAELEQKTQSSLHILKFHRAMDLPFDQQFLPFTGEWSWGKREWQEVTEISEGIWQGKFSAKSLCFQPQYMDPFICKQISLHWSGRIRICSLHLQKQGAVPQGGHEEGFLSSDWAAHRPPVSWAPRHMKGFLPLEYFTTGCESQQDH